MKEDKDNKLDNAINQLNVQTLKEDDALNNIPTYKTSKQCFLNALLNEYHKEIDRKRSFDSRAGLILSFYSAIIALIIDKIHIKKIFEVFNIGDVQSTVLYIHLLSILLFIFLMSSILGCLYYIFKILSPSKFPALNYDFIGINNNLNWPEDDGLLQLIIEYKKVIINMQEINEKNQDF